MTQDEQMDRLERSLRACLKKPIHQRKEPRVTAAKLGKYVKALKDRDIAKDALAARPEDPATQETLRKMEEALTRARNTLKH